MFNLQVLALTLIPILSGGPPGNGISGIALDALLGIQSPMNKHFLVGTWKCTEDFVKWGITDKKKATVTKYKGNAYMSLKADGTMKMTNFFHPAVGRWEIANGGILIFDPQHPERGTQYLQVQKRDNNGLWIMLPFSGGATGLGMTRVQDEGSKLASSKASNKSQ